jgi:hypothetical protein
VVGHGEVAPASEWARWMQVVDRLIRQDASGAGACPNCGAHTVVWRFVAGDDRLGWGAVWCETCGHGVHLSRVKFPEVVSVLPMHVHVQIPRFEVVTPPRRPVRTARRPSGVASGCGTVCR